MQRRQKADLNNLHGTTRQLGGVTNGAKVFPKLLETALTTVIVSESVTVTKPTTAVRHQQAAYTASYHQH